MRLPRAISELTSIFVILLLSILPFSLLWAYSRMSIEASLLRREIRAATIEKEELERKNQALKSAVAGFSRLEDPDRIQWKRYGMLPLSIDNEIVTIRLSEVERLPGEERLH